MGIQKMVGGGGAIGNLKKCEGGILANILIFSLYSEIWSHPNGQHAIFKFKYDF